MKTLLYPCAISLFLAAPSIAATVAIEYFYLSGRGSSSYPDSTYSSGSGELNDGAAASTTWAPGKTTTLAEVDDHVGWLSTSPDLRVEIAPLQLINSVTIWAADSNQNAGVALPSSIRLRTDDGFDQSFPVTDPAGAGTTVPIVISGLNLATDNIRITATQASSWTMFTELQVDASPIPEPSSLFLSLSAGAGLLLRRRRQGTTIG